MSREQKNLWPISIVIIILVVVILIMYTVNLAISHGVVDDNSYLSDKDSVDVNINELYKSKVDFRNNFSLEFLNEKFNLGSNRVNLLLKKKGDKDFVGKIEGYVTRPHTNRDDIDLGQISTSGSGVYSSEVFNIDKEGRWRVLVKIVRPERDAPAVFSYDLNTSR